MIAATFFSGKPCRNGHVAPRLVSNGFCIECRRVVSGKYRNANREKDRAYQTTRRLLHKNEIRAQSRAYRQRNCLVESLGLCAYCGYRKSLELDHIEPLSRGGAHDPENIGAACVSCNRSKQNTPLLLWLAKQALLGRVA